MMKSNIVAILGMIILVFVEILSIEVINSCPAKCAALCFVTEGPYEKCYDSCIANCNKVSPSAYNCIAKCGVNKIVTVTIGTYFLVKFTFSLMFLFFIIQLIILFISFTMTFLYHIVVVKWLMWLILKCKNVPTWKSK